MKFYRNSKGTWILKDYKEETDECALADEIYYGVGGGAYESVQELQANFGIIVVRINSDRP